MGNLHVMNILVHVKKVEVAEEVEVAAVEVAEEDFLPLKNALLEHLVWINLHVLNLVVYA
jgi:hypothetical protein